VIDDHSRVAYVEARDDETKETATEVLRNAVAWFAERGVTVKRVLSDIQDGWAVLVLVVGRRAGSNRPAPARRRWLTEWSAQRLLAC
jgi:hypothetical protein